MAQKAFMHFYHMVQLKSRNIQEPVEINPHSNRWLMLITCVPLLHFLDELQNGKLTSLYVYKPSSTSRLCH